MNWKSSVTAVAVIGILAGAVRFDDFDDLARQLRAEVGKGRSRRGELICLPGESDRAAWQENGGAEGCKENQGRTKEHCLYCYAAVILIRKPCFRSFR